MTNKGIILFVGGLVVLFGLMWRYGGNNQSSALATQTVAQSALTASEKQFDFGTISMAKGKVTKTFQVSNPTSGDIVVTSLATSCMCTNAYIVEPDGSKQGPYGMPGHGRTSTDTVIKAGETRDIEVVFDPAAHGPAGVGRIDRIIEIGDKNGGYLRFGILAVVAP